jgi:hypothetical protein
MKTCSRGEEGIVELGLLAHELEGVSVGLYGLQSYVGQAKGIAMFMHNLVDQLGLGSWCGLGGMHNMLNKG